jgi:hypothetical protein
MAQFKVSYEYNKQWDADYPNLRCLAVAHDRDGKYVACKYGPNFALAKGALMELLRKVVRDNDPPQPEIVVIGG